MAQRYLVSAIVSTYNSERFIRGRLDDLLAQTLGDSLEIIIVNSGSRQNEDDIITTEYLSTHKNIKYIRTDRETIYAAWNRAVQLSEGKFITNANTDDRLRCDAYQVLSNYLLSHNDVAMVYADQYVSSTPNATFNQLRSTKVQRWNNFSYDRLLEGCLTGPQPMWRSSIHFQDNIWFDEKFDVAGDYEFACHVALRHPLHHMPEVLGAYYLSPDKSNKQFQDSTKAFEETYRIKSGYSERYFNQIEREVLYNKFSYYSYWVKRNIAAYYCWKLLFKVWNKDKRLPTREFAFWYASRIMQHIGDNSAAYSICARYLHGNHSPLLKKEIALIDRTTDVAPSFSIIIPTHNRPLFLKDALESLVCQTYKNFEAIVVNNGTVDVAQLIQSYSTKIPVTLFQSDLLDSVSRAKNIGIKNARGKFIAFLDDDDWYHPDHLSTVEFELKKGKHAIIYSDALVEFQNEINGKFETVKKTVTYSREFNKSLLLIKDYIFTPCIVLNAKCFEIAGVFDENLTTDEDMDLWIRMTKFYEFKHIKKITCSVRRTNSIDTLTKNWETLYRNALYLYKKHRSMSKYNVFVLLGQFYYLNLRKRRAKKYTYTSSNNYY